ncbi:MAG: hypothetical protein WAU01_14670 [Saprospiraceae bacterium]
MCHHRSQPDKAVIHDLSDLPPPLTESDLCGLGRYAHIPLSDVPIDFFEWMVRDQIQYPRVQRSTRWRMVMTYIRSHK